MRSIFFGILIAGSLHAAVLPSSYGIEDKEEAFLVRRIAEFWKDQDYIIVKSQIAEFIAKYPKSKINDHLRGVSGDLYLQEKKYEEAIKLYEEIRSADILEKVAINKLQCYYELGKFEKMIDVGRAYLGKETDEIKTRKEEFHFLLGEAYFRKASAHTDQAVKLELMKKAEPLYESVLTSAFKDPAMFALAEIYRARKENQKAASFFLELSQRHAEQREDLLFHAALAQAEFDKKLAIDTFSKIIEKGGAKTKDSELNRFILYFQTENFKSVVDAYPKIINEVDLEKQIALDYIIGRSYFALEDYARASEWLEKFSRLAKEHSPELRNTLLMQLNCAQNLKSEEKYQQTMATLQKHFPEDSELPQANFIHAILLKETGKFDAAEKKLEELFKKNAILEDQETLFLEYSMITYKNENWGKCHATLKSFLKQFPKSLHAIVAWKYFLASCLNLLKENETSYTKENFLQDLNKVLTVQDILTPNEEKECRFLQGKIAYELGRYQEALTYLKQYLVTYHNDPTAAEAHLLVALCHHNLKGDPELFCRHAEVALKSNQDLRNKSSIHLELYNVYLSLIEGNRISKKEDLPLFYDLAAEHLFTALNLQDLQIKLENKLWLANYYLTKLVKLPQIYEVDGLVPRENDFLYQRSRSLFEGVLIKDSHLATIDKEHSFLEWEVLKLANCFGREKQHGKKIALLKELVEQQNKNPNWDWKLQKEVLIELAKAYENENKQENAYETFQFVSTQFKNEPSFASEYAALHSARLKFDLMNPQQRTENHGEVLKILSDLKELQIRKSSETEPLHLEAALEYAWIRAQMSGNEKYVFYLKRIKEDFENMEDPLVANYHKNLKSNSDKLALYTAYTNFLEIEIARCSGKTEGLEQKLSQIVAKAPSYYLQLRAQKSLFALKK